MKRLFIMALAVATLTACEKEIITEEDATVSDGSAIEKTKKFTFTLKGDFSNDWKPVTRGYLSADGKDMTDLWVFDYVDNQLVQQLHQSDNEAEDFGRPTMNLAYGSHHVYFVASRGASPVLNTTDGTIVWSSVRDTFWKDYEVSVVSTSNGNRAVTLDRVVTKLSLTFTDAISTNAATINFTPATWYYGMNYRTGEPTTASTSQTHTISVPQNYIGIAGITTSFFSMSPSAEWNTNATINSKDSDGGVIGSCSLTSVPMKRNRATEYSGPLFNAGGSLSLSLNSDWNTSATGSW